MKALPLRPYRWAKSRNMCVTAILSDSPEVRLETSPQPLTAAPEDSASFLSLKCLADANPAASIKWFRDSVPLGASLVDTAASPSPPSLIQSRTTQLNDSVWGAELRFEPVKRHDAGLYSCKAVNMIGESAPASYRLDVQCSYNCNTLLPIYTLYFLFFIFLLSRFTYRFPPRIIQRVMTVLAYIDILIMRNITLYYCESCSL